MGRKRQAPPKKDRAGHHWHPLSNLDNGAPAHKAACMTCHSAAYGGSFTLEGPHAYQDYLCPNCLPETHECSRCRPENQTKTKPKPDQPYYRVEIEDRKGNRWLSSRQHGDGGSTFRTVREFDQLRDAQEQATRELAGRRVRAVRILDAAGMMVEWWLRGKGPARTALLTRMYPPTQTRPWTIPAWKPNLHGRSRQCDNCGEPYEPSALCRSGVCPVCTRVEENARAKAIKSGWYRRGGPPENDEAKAA